MSIRHLTYICSMYRTIRVHRTEYVHVPGYATASNIENRTIRVYRTEYVHVPGYVSQLNIDISVLDQTQYGICAPYWIRNPPPRLPRTPQRAPPLVPGHILRLSCCPTCHFRCPECAPNPRGRVLRPDPNHPPCFHAYLASHTSGVRTRSPPHLSSHTTKRQGGFPLVCTP